MACHFAGHGAKPRCICRKGNLRLPDIIPMNLERWKNQISRIPYSLPTSDMDFGLKRVVPEFGDRILIHVGQDDFWGLGCFKCYGFSERLAATRCTLVSPEEWVSSHASPLEGKAPRITVDTSATYNQPLHKHSMKIHRIYANIGTIPM